MKTQMEDKKYKNAPFEYITIKYMSVHHRQYQKWNWIFLWEHHIMNNRTKYNNSYSVS